MNDPLLQLAHDRGRARDKADPWANLCVVSTIDANQLPQSRVVVLRDVAERLAVFINGTSPKHTEFTYATHQAVLVYLSSIGVQYRLTTTVEAVPRAIVAASWLDRPRIPKVMDHLYENIAPQSSHIESREAFMARFATLDAQMADDVTAPDQALGYYLTVDRLERLELAGDRPHTRIAYRRTPSGWHAATLIP
jgi:pyridoxamine 5'-phosphate oxidase